MLNKTRLKRLTMLRDLMLNHDTIFPKVHFNMGYWGNLISEPTEKAEIKKLNKQLGRKNKSCGTSACALGSAALYPPFQKLGLKMEISASRFNYPTYNIRGLGSVTEFQAGVEFFGITDAESHFLFDPEDYRAWFDGTQGHRVKGGVAIIPIVPREVANAGGNQKGDYIEEYEVANRIQLLINHYSKFKDGANDSTVKPLIGEYENSWDIEEDNGEVYYGNPRQ